MSRYIGISLLFVMVMSAAAAIEPPTTPRQCVNDGSFRTYMGPATAYRISISTEHGAVSVMDVPAGSLLGVSGAAGSKTERLSEDGSSFRCSGDITIRVRRMDDVASDEDRSGLAMMAKAAVVTEVHAGTVEVMVVEPDTDGSR